MFQAMFRSTITLQQKHNGVVWACCYLVQDTGEKIKYTPGSPFEGLTGTSTFPLSVKKLQNTVLYIQDKKMTMLSVVWRIVDLVNIFLVYNINIILLLKCFCRSHFIESLVS